jgi:hypothetical protein
MTGTKVLRSIMDRMRTTKGTMSTRGNGYDELPFSGTIHQLQVRLPKGGLIRIIRSFSLSPVCPWWFFHVETPFRSRTVYLIR